MRLCRRVLRLETMRDWMSLLADGLRDEAGVTAIEYGLLAALIAVAIIGGASATGTSLEAVYVYWTGEVTSVMKPAP